MSDFSKEKFLGGKLTPTSIFRRIGEVWESQNAVVPDRVLNRTDVPPYESDLLLWTGKTYDPTTHQIKSRISPQYNLTLKQGLCASFNGTSSECSLATPIDLTGNWSMKISFAPAVVDVLRYLVSEAVTSPTRRFYVRLNSNGKVNLKIGTGAEADISGVLSVGVSYTLYMSYSSTTGIITSKLKTLSTGALTDLTDYTVEGLNATTGTWRIGRAPTGGWYSGCIHELTIWKSTKTVAQMDSTKTDAELCIPFSGSTQGIKGNIVINSANITYGRSDYSTFRSDEYGFAVKSGVIYPKLLDGSGYAGLVGEPDATYHGLIAQTGKIEVKGQSYFDTLFSFTQNPNTEIEDAGIIIHGAGAMNGENCNSNNILTAETSLNTSYPNALTASVLNTESIQVFNGTNNANQRMFVKVTNPVYKADNSSLLESGTITDILVYKRNLTPEEQVRVMLWCHNLDFLSVDLVKVGAEYLFVDDNIVYVCKV